MPNRYKISFRPYGGIISEHDRKKIIDIFSESLFEYFPERDSGVIQERASCMLQKLEQLINTVKQQAKS